MYQPNCYHKLKKKEKENRQRRLDEMVYQGSSQSAAWQFHHRAYAADMGKEEEALVRTSCENT